MTAENAELCMEYTIHPYSHEGEYTFFVVNFDGNKIAMPETMVRGFCNDLERALEQEIPEKATRDQVRRDIQ